MSVWMTATCDAGEGSVLPLDAQPGVPHDEDEEPRLPLSETVIGDRLDAFDARHSNSSSARRPWCPPPPRPPLPPPMRAAAPIAREPGPAVGRAMRAAIVFGHHFDVQVILASIDVAILDPTVRKVHLSIEERQVVIVRPLRDLALVAIGPAVSIWSVAITLVEPLLVLALQLVVQPHPLDLQAPLLEPRCLALIGAVDLRVVFELALAFEPCVERLTRIPIAVSIRIQHAPATLRQNHRLFPVARDSYGFDQTLFAEMSEVAVTWIRWSVVTVSEVAGRHDAESPDGRERATLRSPECVFVITSVVNDFGKSVV